MRFATLLAALVLAACASTPSAPPPAPAPATSAAPQSAEGTEAAPTTVASAETPAKKELICRDEPGTGTHVRRTRRICATEEEWARRREEDQKALGDLSRRAGQSTPSGR